MKLNVIFLESKGEFGWEKYDFLIDLEVSSEKNIKIYS